MNTEEQQPPADQQQKSESSISFTPEVAQQNGVGYEQTQTREGIKPISSVDILDEEELANYLLQLQSLSGAPEATEIYEIQKANLITNATNGEKQRRLTHREVYKEIQANTAKEDHQQSTKSFLDRVPVIKGIRSAYKNHVEKKLAEDARNSVDDTSLMLAKHWRQDEHDLPTFDVTESKEQRDLYYNFDTLYRQLILNLADFVGKLPASESNHHNWPGGLLKHSLEVASISFKYAKSWDLPPIAMNDYEARRRPRWQYAAWVIGLFHDVGKAITDMVVVCEDANGKIYRWNPMLNSLNEFCADRKIVRYYIDMNDASRYMNSAGRFKRHEGMASSLLDKLLTPESRHFLTSSPDPGFGLYEQVSSILSGKKGGDKYLMDALNRGEELSVHLSYKKIRSDFHLNNRNASIAELMMRELPYMLEYENFMKNVFVVSGYVMLRYPEALNQLKQAVINKSPETKAILNYSAMELGKQLSSSNFIRKVNANNFLPRFAPTKEVFKRDKNTREEMVTYEREVGFCPVVILEHAALLFGKNELPPSITGVLSLNMEHSLEFLRDGDVIEHIHERPAEESAEPKGTDILDPEASFNVVKKIKTQVDQNDPDSMPGEKTLELKKGEVKEQTNAQAGSNAQQGRSKGVQQQKPKPQQQNQATPSTEASKPKQNTGSSSSKPARPRQQAMRAAKSQSDEKSPVQRASVDVFSLDQPPAVVAETKVHDAPESLVQGVDSSAAEIPNEKNDRKSRSALLAQTGEVTPSNGSTNVDTGEAVIATPQDMPFTPNSESVPLDMYSDMPMYDEQEGPDYDDIFSLPPEMTHDAPLQTDLAPMEPNAGGQELAVGNAIVSHKPRVDVITELFAEWVGISANNRTLAETRSIPFMLFKSPFFVDSEKRAGRPDWAFNGNHVERRNKTTVKLKQSFVDTVLAYVDGNALPENEFNLSPKAESPVPVEPAASVNDVKHQKAQTDASKSADEQSSTSAGEVNSNGKVNNSNIPPAMNLSVCAAAVPAAQSNLSVAELKKQARKKASQKTELASDTGTDKSASKGQAEKADLKSNQAEVDSTTSPQKEIPDQPVIGKSVLLERLRNHVVGNLKIEPKFKKGLVPKPMFISILKGIDHTPEEAEAIGLVKKVDVRNYHIDTDVLYGFAEPKETHSPKQGSSKTELDTDSPSKDSGTQLSVHHVNTEQDEPLVDKAEQAVHVESVEASQTVKDTSVKANEHTYEQLKNGDVEVESFNNAEASETPQSIVEQEVVGINERYEVNTQSSVHGVNTGQGVNSEMVDAESSEEMTVDINGSSDHGVISKPEVEIVTENVDHQDESLDHKLEAALERAISRLDIGGAKIPDVQAEFIKLDISCNKEGDYPNLDFMSLTILLAGKIKKGEVISVDPSRLNRDGTVDIVLSDFIIQCVEYLESKRGTFKILSKFDEDKLEQIATGLWVQNASTKNKITLTYTKD
ncbi:TraI domain-containing protein [Vibrio sp. 10N.239.312.D08]|uniref:TraI domain-containing protein n=1 Tax=Vibrio sp. 10N.239.312.D08 TaxID=3229978 RepID=UPI0035532A04